MGQIKNLGAAVSLANLLMLALWDEAQDHWFDYFRKLPDAWFIPTQITISLILYAVIGWGIWTLAQRSRITAVRRACLVILSVLFIIAVEMLFSRANALRPIHAFASANIGVGKLALFLAAASAFAVVRWEATARNSLRVVLLILLPMFPLVLFQSISPRLQLEHQSVFENRPLATRLEAKPGMPRVVWIIFDEFDEKLAFSNRPAGLELPELDRLKESVFRTNNAQTAGMETEISVPALFTGRAVKEVQREPNELLLLFQNDSKRVPWSEQPSVFSKARELGASSALVGFYHPYCRILNSLANCDWFPAFFVAGYERAYLDNLGAFDRLMFHLQQPLFRSNLAGRLPMFQRSRRRRRAIFTYRSINERALRAAIDPDFALVFLHFPVPHLPGIYDRNLRTTSTATDKGYLDNLALVDKTLLELRKQMEAAGLWDKSAVVISSDHPLRERSRREAEGNGEQLGPFPQAQSRTVPFMVKMPGPAQSVLYEKPFSTVLTEGLILAILQGEVTDSRGVASWIDQHRER